MNSKVLFFVVLAVILPLVSATNCWDEHEMPLGSMTYSAWLCISGPNYGWIYSISPSGYPYGSGRMFKAELSAYTGISPYAATLKCYEQFTDVEPPSKILPKTGVKNLNSVPPGPSYSWHFISQVTLNYGEQTLGGSAWVNAGCPPVMNANHQAGSPPQVQITVNWPGYNLNRAISVSTPLAVSSAGDAVAFNPVVSLVPSKASISLFSKKPRR